MSGDGRPPRPGEFVDETAGGAAADGEIPGDEPGGPGMGKRVINGLLSTDPPEEPSLGKDKAIEHLRIGLKKFLNGALGADMGAGRTAAEDFGLAAIHGLSGDDGSDSDSDSAPSGVSTDDLAGAGPPPEGPDGTP